LNLANYICDLLYRYECVIIPQFGGFVANERSARIDKNKQTIYPPYKQITFNSHLKNNDGLLANYISSTDKISYDCALNYIKFEIESWTEKLRNEDLSLPGLGTFSSVSGKLHFEPQQKTNYLLSSFGLTSVLVRDLHESVETEPSQEDDSVPVVPLVQKKTPAYLKYAAVFVLGLSAIGFGAKLYQDYRSDQWVAEAEKQQKRVEQKIENATFVITKPLPALNIELESKKKNFHVIAGAFRFPENADRKVNQLLNEGYEARILGVNRWNLTVVSYGSFSTRDEALKELDSIQKYVAKDSWLLIQEF
jgi:nucleoid DNA-binding protein